MGKHHHGQASFPNAAYGRGLYERRLSCLYIAPDRNGRGTERHSMQTYESESLVTTFRIPVKGHKTGRRRIIRERKRREGNYLFIQINEITVEPERQQKAQKEHIQRLMESMERIGLISPITLDAKYKLIAGLHRLEAAKALGWDEIECAVRTVDGLMRTSFGKTFPA